MCNFEIEVPALILPQVYGMPFQTGIWGTCVIGLPGHHTNYLTTNDALAGSRKNDGWVMDVA